MNTPLVSIVIPVYNVEKYIVPCLESVLSQTFQDFELILVNDQTPDDSIKLAAEYLDGRLPPERYLFITNPQNVGLGYTRNAGVRAAKGDYIFFLDSDDMLHPSHLEHLIRALMSGEYDYCFSGVERFTEPHELETTSCEYDVEIFDYYKKADILRLHGYACGNIYKRSVIVENHVDFTNIPYMEDVIFNSEYLLNVRRVAYVKSAIYYYRRNQNSLTHIGREKTAENNMICLLAFDHKFVCDSAMREKYRQHYGELLQDRRYVCNCFFGELKSIGYGRYREIVRKAKQRRPGPESRKLLRGMILRSDLSVLEKCKEYIMSFTMFERLIYKLFL